MTEAPYLLTGLRSADGESVDLLVVDGKLADPETAGPDIRRVDGKDRLVLPSLIEGHVHLDKTFLGCAWQPHLPGASVAERIAQEKVARAKVSEPVGVRGARLVERLLERGVGRIRTHVDIDPEWGLTNLEGQLAIRERYRDAVDIEIVAFPQSGILKSPGTAELLDEALRQGADLIGGLDPAGIDGDPVRHLDIVFDLASRHGRGVDIHLHDGNELGCLELRMIAERTAALGMRGKVTVSHAFALGEASSTTFGTTAEALAKAGVSIMTSAPARPMPPVKALKAAGVNVFAGSDNIRDAWSPHGNGDTLERATLVAYQQGWRADEDLALALAMVTSHAARAMGIQGYGLHPGRPADLMLIEAETVAEAVAQRPLDRVTIKRGRVVAEGSERMKILLANSNTSPDVTAKIAAAAVRAASPGTEIVAKNANFGARVIGTRAEAAVAAHGLVDMLAEHAPGCDAVIIGMSYDTGLWAAREMLDIPVVGMTEASLLLACTLAPRFGLVTFASRGTEIFHEIVAGYGLSSRLAGVAGIQATPYDMLADPEALYRPMVECANGLIEKDGAECIVLVGAVMAGLVPVLQERIPVPVLEGISAGVHLAESLARLKPAKPRVGSLQPVPRRETIGLGPALTGYFGAKR